MSRFFKSKKKSQDPQFVPVHDPFKSLRKKTASHLEGQIGKPGPKFTGELVAPPTEFEETSLDRLRKVGERPPITRGLNIARQEIDRIFSGGVDPTASPYYQAIKAAAERTGEERREAINRRFATKTGRFSSGARLEQLGETDRDVNIALNLALAEQVERERSARERAIPLATGLDEAELRSDLAPIEALQTYGALPRQLRQAYNDALREEFHISEREYPLNILQLSSGLAAQQPIFAQRGFSFEPSPFRKILTGGYGLLNSFRR